VRSASRCNGAEHRGKADTGTRLRYREVSSGGSFGSNSYVQHVGLGKAALIDTLEITWPASKTRQVFKRPPIDSWLEVTELAEAPVVRPRKPFKLGGATPPAAHQH